MPHSRSLKKKPSLNEVLTKDALSKILIHLLKVGVDDLLHLAAPTQEQQPAEPVTGSVADPFADICEIPQSQQEALENASFYQEAGSEIPPANGPLVVPETPRRDRLDDSQNEIDYFSSLKPTRCCVEYTSW